MEDLDPREEQLQSIKVVYDGLNVFVCLPTEFWKSLCYQAIPFVMDFKQGKAGTSKTSAILVVSSCLPDGWPGWGHEKEESEDPNHHFWKWFGQTPLSWRDKPSLLFCVPEALALLSTACAHNFYTCRRRFRLICPQEHPVAGGPPPLYSSGRKEVHCLCWFYHRSAQPKNFCVALGSHFHSQISFHELVMIFLTFTHMKWC